MIGNETSDGDEKSNDENTNDAEEQSKVTEKYQADLELIRDNHWSNLLWLFPKYEKDGWIFKYEKDEDVESFFTGEAGSAIEGGVDYSESDGFGGRQNGRHPKSASTCG